MILYLSATGNTEWAARQVAQATGDRLLRITEAREITLQDGEPLGLLFPVHGWRPPRLVRDFVDRLTITGRHYIYAICTAGDNIGETMDILQKHLKRRGQNLDAAFTLIMPNVYVGLPFMDIDSVELTKRKKAAAEKKLKQEIIPWIMSKEEIWDDLVRGRWPKIDSRLLGEAFERWLITDKPFHVDSQRCVKCGICQDVCPVDNIQGGLGYEPKWKHSGQCLTCFACYHHCPHHAIEYGSRTRHKGQYFFNKNL